MSKPECPDCAVLTAEVERLRAKNDLLTKQLGHYEKHVVPRIEELTEQLRRMGANI